MRLPLQEAQGMEYSAAWVRLRYVTRTILFIFLVGFPVHASATSVSYGKAVVPALSPDGKIRFVVRSYYCWNRTAHEDAVPQVLTTPIRWEAEDEYCRFNDEYCSWEDDTDDGCKKTAVTSVDHRKQNEVNPFRVAQLQLTMVGYRCPVVVRIRGKPSKKYWRAFKRAGLNNQRALMKLLRKTLEENLAGTRFVDCGIEYRGIKSSSRLPKRFNQAVPNHCFRRGTRRGDVRSLWKRGRALRRAGKLERAARVLHQALARDCRSEQALLERSLVYALQKQHHKSFALLDRLHTYNAGRAFTAYRDNNVLSAQPRPYTWNRFLARYDRWSTEGCSPIENKCVPPERKK